MDEQEYIQLEETFGAHNYNPLNVVLCRGEGVWVWDVEGKRSMDCLAAYSAVNQGHCHPRIMRTMIEAVRKWGYEVKGVPRDRAEIIVCQNNFHGRTITIVGFSSEEHSREGFGPFTPGFKTIPFGDAEALEEAITPNTVAFLVEPIQGEAGVIIPPEGYLREVRGKGLMIGVAFFPESGGARRLCERLATDGLLCKETHDHLHKRPEMCVRRHRNPKNGVE